jgi:hypothetical protein
LIIVLKIRRQGDLFQNSTPLELLLFSFKVQNSDKLRWNRNLDWKELLALPLKLLCFYDESSNQCMHEDVLPSWLSLVVLRVIEVDLVPEEFDGVWFVEVAAGCEVNLGLELIFGLGNTFLWAKFKERLLYLEVFTQIKLLLFIPLLPWRPKVKEGLKLHTQSLFTLSHRGSSLWTSCFMLLLSRIRVGLVAASRLRKRALCALLSAGFRNRVGYLLRTSFFRLYQFGREKLFFVRRAYVFGLSTFRARKLLFLLLIVLYLNISEILVLYGFRSKIFGSYRQG